MFGSERDRWRQKIIDSRTARFTNKTLIEEWINDYGEDSDFVRVRVRGIAPRAGRAPVHRPGAGVGGAAARGSELSG